MIVWTPAVLSVLYACALYVCICPCSAQLSMLHVERRSRNTLIIIILPNARRYRLCERTGWPGVGVPRQGQIAS